jgi:hypothetical protein
MASVAIGLKNYSITEEDADGLTILRFRYLPLSRLAACDPNQEQRLEQMIYIQMLIDEDCE